MCTIVLGVVLSITLLLLRHFYREARHWQAQYSKIWHYVYYPYWTCRGVQTEHHYALPGSADDDDTQEGSSTAATIAVSSTSSSVVTGGVVTTGASEMVDVPIKDQDISATDIIERKGCEDIIDDAIPSPERSLWPKGGLKFLKNRAGRTDRKGETMEMEKLQSE